MNTRLCQTGVLASKVPNPSAPSAASPVADEHRPPPLLPAVDGARGEGGRQHEAQQERVDQQSRARGAHVAHALEVAGQQEHAGVQARGGRGARDEQRGDRAVGEQPQRHDRRGGAPLHGQERREDARRRRPSDATVRWSSPTRTSPTPTRQQGDPGDVDAARSRPSLRPSDAGRNRATTTSAARPIGRLTRNAQRQPGLVGEEAAEQRPER